MQITCPACAAAYDVPDSKLRPGGAVRCARCGGRWAPLPAAPPADPPAAPAVAAVAAPAPVPPAPPAAPHPFAPPASAPPAAPEAARPPQALRRYPLPSAERRRRALLGLAWAASLGLLGLGVVLAVALRAEIAAAWPPALRLFRALGLG